MKAKITLVLVALLFLGWGCADKSVVSNKSGQDTVASVDTTPSLDTTKPTDTNAPDTIKPTDTTKPLDAIKPKDTSPVDTGTKDVSNVPEGWKVYENQEFKIAYPGLWYAKADDIQS